MPTYNQVFGDPRAYFVQITNVLFEINRDVIFKCVRCAMCCVTNKAPLRHPEIKLYKKMGYKDFTEPDTQGKAWSGLVIRRVKGKCFFLSDDFLCTIYKHRPLICKTYPFCVKGYDQDKKLVLATYMIEGAESKTLVCQGFHRGKPTLAMLRPYVKPLRDEWEYSLRCAMRAQTKKK